MISTRSTRSLDSFSALKLAKILEMMDMPPGTVNIVTEPGAIIGDALPSHFDLDIVVFRSR